MLKCAHQQLLCTWRLAVWALQQEAAGQQCQFQDNTSQEAPD
jgi:hypothetical protein